jgi:hypothetical protein
VTTTSTTSTTATTTTTVPVIATLTITPATRSSPWTVAAQPVLTWSVTGASSVLVQGAEGLSLTAPQGSQPLCLTPIGSLCAPAAGPYVYTLTARDAGGAVVAERMATLTVT